MKQLIKLGVVCLARKTFDFAAAAEIFQNIQTDLKKIEQIDWKIVDTLLIEIPEAQDAALFLKKNDIDAIICISGTFALGHLILELNKILHVPILLWGLNELPYDGGKIRLNSICGVNLNASNLYKGGVKNFYVNIGDTVDQDWIDAIRIHSAIKNAHIGVIGYRAKGFFNLDVDELDLYEKTGLLIDHFELQSVFNTPVDEKNVNIRKSQIKEIFDISTLTEAQINKVAELAEKFKQFLDVNTLTSVAVRCWPEFAQMFGISPCAAMSLLQSEGHILTCEGDILGSVSQIAHVACGGETPFLADFSQIDIAKNFALLWHCGVAPCNLWDKKCNRSLETYFAGGKGVTADFVLKSGPLSLLRIDYSPGEYRIFLQSAEAIPMEKSLRGTYMKTIFKDGVKTVLDKIVYNGIAHHISVVYGDFIKPLEIFGKIMNWNIIN